MNNLDNEIKKALSVKAENVQLPENLLNTIKTELGKKENNDMKKFRFTPKLLIATLALTAILATGVIGAGKIVSTRSSSSRLDDINHFPALEEIENIVDFSPKYTETLGSHKFKFANPGNSQNMDEKGNVINDYKDISFWYETDNKDAILTLSAQPAFTGLELDENYEQISYNGITLYYSSCAYKAVPPDYVKTDEDKKLEESGKLMIGYGSDKIEEKNTQSLSWSEDGITYNLMDMGEEIDKTEFIEMAKQVIDVR
ncbi:MAG: hypothetical protein Q4D26_01780 [Clostridia bacterium]|nr:hypothetical protein [Clostridia bacterium]